MEHDNSKNVKSSCENHFEKGAVHHELQEKHFLTYLKCCAAAQIQIGFNCQRVEMCEISVFTQTQQRQMEMCCYHSIESFYFDIFNGNTSFHN